MPLEAQNPQQILKAANTRVHMVGTTEEQLIQQRKESPVKSGPTPSPMTICSPMLVITTSAEILLGVIVIKCGATPLTLP